LLCLAACAATYAQDTDLADGASASASEHFSLAKRAFEQEDWLRALAEFQAAIAGGDDGPAARYNAAVCYYRLADYARAASAFADVGQRYPAMRALADYNVGLALTKVGSTAEARQAFERSAATGDERLGALARAMLARLPADTPPPPSPAWTGFVAFDAGHDGNVALVDGASLPSGRSTDSALGEMLAYLSGAPGQARAWRLDASVFVVTYSDAGEFDQAGAYLGGAREWRPGRLRILAGPHYSQTTLNGTGFEQRLGLAFDAWYEVDADLTFRLRAVHDEIDDLDSRFAYVEGDLDSSGVTFSKTTMRGRVAAGYDIERDTRVGEGVTADRQRYAIEYRRSLGDAWGAQLLYEYRISDYDLLAPPRDEKRRQIAVEATRRLRAGWQFTARYNHTHNNSTDPFYKYDRDRVTVGLGKTF
jgi:tetratricopeptide (TPR) repeat protein